MAKYSLKIDGRTVAGVREVKAKDVEAWVAKIARAKDVSPKSIEIVTQGHDERLVGLGACPTCGAVGDDPCLAKSGKEVKRHKARS